MTSAVLPGSEDIVELENVRWGRGGRGWEGKREIDDYIDKLPPISATTILEDYGPGRVKVEEELDNLEVGWLVAARTFQY